MTIGRFFLTVTACVMVYIFIDLYVDQQDGSTISVYVEIEKHSNSGKTISEQLLRHAKMIGNAPVSVYQWNGSFSLSNKCSYLDIYNRNRLYFNKNYPMYLYDAKQDLFVSRQIINTGVWKPALSDAILGVMKMYPDMGFIDIGGGLGMLSLEVGMRGYDVILVDPSESNVQRFCASIKLNNIMGSVSIVLNPLSSRHEILQMVAENVRLSEWFVVDDNPLRMAQTNSSRFTVTENVVATTLDDLLYLPELLPNRNLVVHLDTAGYDEKVLKGGEFFFELKGIKVIFTDWKYNRNSLYSGTIIKFMVDRGFKPFDLKFRISLLDKQQSDWPETVAWIHSCLMQNDSIFFSLKSQFIS